MTAQTKPVPASLPAITPVNRGFWEHARLGVLALPHCRSCNHVWYPPSSCCPVCLGTDVEFRAVSGRAKLWSWIVMHRQYLEDFPPPYVVAFVELEEGPMLMSALTNVAAEALRCDLPLQAVFDKLTDEIHLLKFEPA
jgi:uncharacterized OB-fold protein